ncbi:dihydrofolate reductase family protein [Corticibacterium sp. UT-5YL-CI-8]|nr:dihydrofolate reductase family protein [Tianweitania sp. UT-5YL-CI-8]
MTGTEVVYMFAMSLDGYIAREDGSFDWLENYPANADFDFDTFLASLSGIVMGRGTYDAVRSGGKWDYGDHTCLVATSRSLRDLPTRTEAMSGTPAELIANLRHRGASGRIWLLGGGDLARQFMQARLLDTIEIGTIPIILGKGIRAFGKTENQWLDLVFAKQLKNGAIHAQYKVKR